MGKQMIEFIIEGIPQGKGRPKFSSRGSFVRVYTPKKTADYEKVVREAYGNRPKCDDVPLKVVIRAYYPIPKSMSKKELQLALIGKKLPLVKPDIDNVSKIILDSLNDVAYEDDKQVVSLTIEKFYSQAPRVVVSIYEIDL